MVKGNLGKIVNIIGAFIKPVVIQNTFYFLTTTYRKVRFFVHKTAIFRNPTYNQSPITNYLL